MSVAITEFDDHDLALIRRELELLPHERLSGMVSAVNTLASMESATRA